MPDRPVTTGNPRSPPTTVGWIARRLWLLVWLCSEGFKTQVASDLWSYGGAPVKRIVVRWMGPQLLALRGPPPHEPPVPVAYVLAQLDPLNTELSTGDRRVRAAITVTLRAF